MTFLDDLTTVAGDLAERVGPAVVRVGRDGNGVVVTEGQVLTNAHNVRGPEVRVVIVGEPVTARVLGSDMDGDLTVLGVDTAGIAPLPFSSGAPRIGNAAFAVAATDSGPRLTLGFVSGVSRSFRGPRGRRIAGSIEHTAPLAPGSSGSALVDAGGSLVGLNTHRVGSGFYLAIPADAALRSRVASLARGEAPVRPRLGIAVAPGWAARRMRQAVGLDARDGLLVREVEPGGVAAEAEIAVGDLIVRVNATPVTDVDDLADAIDAAAGGALELDCLRGNEERRATISLVGRS